MCNNKLYYKCEVIQGRVVYDPGQRTQHNGPEYYYSAVIRFSNDPAWYTFKQATSGCLSVLKGNRNSLLANSPESSCEINDLNQIIARLEVTSEHDLELLSATGKTEVKI